ncbi:MAG: SigE family RNA polymerase sigma factor [Acidimicrobiia bacterium]
MTISEPDRVDPINQTRGGDRSASSVPLTFDEFFDDGWSLMVRLAIGLIDDRSRAEEIAQDSFERALVRWDRLDNPGAFVRTCVVNAARSELRRRRVMRLKAEPVRRPPVGDGPDVMLDALLVLSPRQRSAVVLRYWLDLPDAEIARLLGVRPGTVRSLLSRALDELREVVEK